MSIAKILFLPLFFLSFNIYSKAENIDINKINSFRVNAELEKAIIYVEDCIKQLPLSENYTEIKLVIPYIILGNLFLELEELESAEKYLLEAVTVMDKNAGWLYPDYAIALNQLVTLYLKTDRVEIATQYLKEVKDIEKKTIGRHIININTLCNQGLLYSRNQTDGSIDSVFQKSIDLAKSNFEPFVYYRDKVIIEIYYVDYLIKSGAFNKAQDRLLRIKSELVKKGLEKTSNYTKTLVALGDVYCNKAAYNNSLQFYKQSLLSAEIIYGKKRIAYANILFKLSNLYLKHLEVNKAETIVMEGVKIYDNEGVIDNKYTNGLISLANCYHIRGEYEKSKEVFDKVEKYIDNNSENYQNYLASLVRFYFAQDKYIKTELLLSELSNSIGEEYQFYINEYRFFVLISIEFNIVFGRYGRCEQLIKQANNFITTAKNKNALYEMYTSYAYASYLHAVKKYNESLLQLEKLDQKVIQSYGDKYLRKFQINYLQALNYSALGDYDKVIQKCNDIQELKKIYNIQETELYSIRTENILAKGYFYLKQYDKAIEIYKNVLTLVPEVSLLASTTLANIAYIQALEGDWKNAEINSIEASLQRLKFYDITLAFSTEDEKRLYLKSTSDVFDIFDALIYRRGEKSSPKMLEHCYNLNILYKDFFKKAAIVAKENLLALEKHRVENNFPSSLDKLYLLRNKVATLSYMSSDEIDSLNINPYQVVDRAKNLEKTMLLASNSFEYADDGLLQTWKSVSNRLGPEDVSIDILKISNLEKTKTQYYAFLMDDNCETPLFISLGDSEFLEGDVFEKYKSSIRKTQRGMLVLTTDKDPYDVYWKPIKEGILELKNKAYRYFICPYGIYNFVNINTLKNPKTNEFVIKEDYVFYVSSTLDEINQKDNIKEIKNKSAVLVGNPIFSKKDKENFKNKQNTSAKGAPSRGYNDQGVIIFNLPELPGTEIEIKNINDELSKNNWEVKEFLQEMATEKTLLELKSSPTVLHIATHGFFINNVSKQVTNSRLVKAGLFLSEISEHHSTNYQERFNSGRDGILTAYEVMAMDLRQTELVILSACQTEQLSDIGEEGVSALQFAFKVAGAKSLLMSLWSIDDDATALLMMSFYEKWLCCKDRYQAFREAQYERMQDPAYSSPYYWGAFVMIN